MTPDLTVTAAGDHGAVRIRPAALPGPIPLDGRLVGLPAGYYDWLHLVLRAPVPGEAECWLHYTEGVDPETSVWPAGDPVAVRVPVTRRTALAALRLPVAPGAELLALALVTQALAERVPA
jgi:hypothetical protein